MKRILVTGTGGSAATNFVRSLKSTSERFYIVGTDSNKYYLARSEADKNYLVSHVENPKYLDEINKIVEKEKVEFIHVQNDQEVLFFSQNRNKVQAKLFLPSNKTISICLNKYRSYNIWKKSHLSVPETMMIKDENDLKRAFKMFCGKLWLRNIKGAGGRGSLPVSEYKIAKAWLDFHIGWGKFSASVLLTSESATWMSIWKNGDLIVAQGRKRLYWELSKISPSGITGVTGAGKTISDSLIDEIAKKSIFAIDKKPNGLFGVDLTYDKNGIPNPTEINIRFFTTHHFFTQAGLNMPYIYIKLAYNENPPVIAKKINPLKTGLIWIRGVDFLPILTNEKKIEAHTLRIKKKWL